jgi:hypothetical protein
MKQNNEKIIRKIKTLDRMIEIIRSMREPQVHTYFFNEEGKEKGIPQLKIKANAKNGVCEYIYIHSGILGLSEAKKKINNEIK